MARLSVGMVGIVGSFAALAASFPASEEKPMKRLTPVLVVDAIEPSLALWVDRLGFDKTVEAPEGEKLGFVALSKDGLEIMYQTRASIAKEVETAGMAAVLKSAGVPSVVFIEIESLDELRNKVEGMKILVPYRETFYGSKELWLEEPGGHIIGFAEMPRE